MHTPRGFTLIELVVTLAVAAILTVLAIPGYTTTVKNNRLHNAANAFVAAVNLARVESVRRNARVTLCKSGDGNGCATRGDWSQGWIVFVDANSNAARDGGEQLIRGHESLHATLSIAGNTPVANYISFVPSGRPKLTTNAFQAGTITVCDDREGLFGVNLVLNVAGRLRLDKGVKCP